MAMSEKKSQDWLVWAVLALMLVAGVAALAFSPGLTDGNGQNGQNRSPLARIAPANLSVNLGDSVDFSGANSSDPDGSVKAFAWDFGDGTSGTGAIVSHQFDVTGAFVVRLEVTDDKGSKNFTTTNVWVNLNQPVPAGVATWSTVGSAPSNVPFPVDPAAVRLAITVQLNTSNILGAKATVTVLDPNGGVLATTNQTLSPGTFPSPIQFLLNQDNLTVEGEWTLRVEADRAVGTQVTVAVGYQGSIRVEYKP